jgi:short-subunit dehydrogenase
MMSKRIVVIGASTGIGNALVHVAAKENDCKVIAFARNTDLMKQSFKSLSNVSYHHLDLEDINSNDFSQVLDQFGHIDILINNAGFLVNKPFKDLCKDDLVKSFQVNTIGIMEITKLSIPYLNKTNSHIVNISSMGGFQGSAKFPGLTAYSSAKAALCAFTEVFAEEYKDSSIKMNCLCLGAVQTKMLEKAFPGFKAEISPKEMGSYIFDFARKQGRFLNGKIIPVSLSTP